MKLKLEAPPALSVSRSTFARALSHVLLPAAAVAFAADAPAEPQRVLDLESYLRDAQRTRLERILQTLETDTGYKLRVATQSRATAPGLKSLRAQVDVKQVRLIKEILRQRDIRDTLRHYMGRRNCGTKRCFYYAAFTL